MIYYTPSSITESNTLLEKLQWIEKYLKNNPMAQFFITSDEYNNIDGQQFNIDSLKNKGEINVGDVVFFVNSYIGIVQFVFADKYTVYPNLVNIKGGQGNRGEKGQSYIVCRHILNLTENQLNNNERFDINTVDLRYDNTYEETGYNIIPDSYILFIGICNERKYIGFYIVESSTSSKVTGYINSADTIDITGKQGIKGKNYIVYTGLLGLDINQDYDGGLVKNFAGSSFSEMPDIGDYFFAITYKEVSGVRIYNFGQWIVNEIIDIQDDKIIKAQYRFGDRITGEKGEQGEQGIQGEQGLSYLICTHSYGGETLPQVGETLNIDSSYFNRQPQNGDVGIVFYGYGIPYPTIEKYFILTVQYSAVNEIYTILSLQDIIGKSGQGFNYRGEWVINNEYKKYDIVKYNGSQYFCEKTILDSAVTPDLDHNNFSLFLESGGGGSGSLNLYKIPISAELSVQVEYLKYVKNNYGSISFIGDMTIPQTGGNVIYPNSCFFVYDETDNTTDNVISFNITSIQDDESGVQKPVSGIVIFKFKNNSIGEISGELVQFQEVTQGVTQ